MVERFLRPTSAEQALREREQSGGSFLAGGTELNWHGAVKAKTVVSLAGLGLGGIAVRPDAVLVGATVTLQQLVDAGVLRSAGLGVLCDAAAAVGSRSIRAQATVGGNVGANKSCGDLLPPLVALGAELQLTSLTGSREMAVEQFLLAPERNALITAVRIPRLRAGARVARHRFSRSVNDLATVHVALMLALDGGVIGEARLAVGGVAPTAVRLAAAEAVLAGAKVGADAAVDLALAERLAAAVQAAARPIDDVRGSAGFKRELAGALAVRAFESCVNGQGGAR